jgi:amino acid transporter
MKSSSPPVDSPQVLRANALSFPSVLMQSITHIAPAVGLVFVLQFITTMAGIAAPLAFALAFFSVLAIAVCMVQLALHLPSAGGYYTYVSRALNPKAGFLAAWMFFLYEPPTAAVNLAFLSYMLHNIVKMEAGISCPWYVLFLAAVLLITVLIYRGIEISAIFVIWLTAIEILIVGCLAISGFLHPGDGRIHLGDFASLHSFKQKGFYLAVAFSILIFTGFESVAPLAEETRNPRRTLPRAVLLSTTLMGLFFVVCAMALLTGWGNSHIASFASSTEPPVILLAKRLWGPAWVLVLIAVTNSILAVAIAGNNAATRVFFAMGRARSLPAVLDYVHPRFQTPRNAILLQTFLTLAIGLGIGLWIGPDQEYYVIAVAMTLGLMFIYCAGNIGVFFYYRRERPAEFRFLLHFLLPLLSTISLLWVAYKSAVPLPEPPVRYAPIVAAVWLFCGVVIMLTARRAGGAPLLPLDAVSTVHACVAASAVLGAPATGEPIG